MLVRLLVIGFILNFSVQSFSQVFDYSLQPLKCSQKGTLVTFTNGIDTQEKIAKEYMRRIKTFPLAKTKIDKSGKVEYLLIYNQTEGPALDLYESARQKIAAFYNTSLIKAAASFFGVVYNILSPVVPVTLRIQIDAIKKGIIQNFSLERDSAYQETMARHAAAWTKAFDIDGQKILAISHSQGGLFLNDAYEKLMTGRNSKFKDLFAMLQVASPVGEVIAKNRKGKKLGYHLINDRDVIKTVRGALLLPNLFLSPAQAFEAGLVDGNFHGFQDIYLKYFSQDIQNQMERMASFLGPNCGCERPDGTTEAGAYYINPDGTDSGFVANTVEAYEDEYHQMTNFVGPDVELCGYVSLHGNNYFDGDIKISGSQLPNKTTEIYNSRFKTSDTARIRILDISYIAGSYFSISGAGYLGIFDSSSLYNVTGIFNGSMELKNVYQYNYEFYSTDSLLDVVMDIKPMEGYSYFDHREEPHCIYREGVLFTPPVRALGCGVVRYKWE
jgi:hypothetical protein